jgi:hypothetical protein
MIEPEFIEFTFNGEKDYRRVRRIFENGKERFKGRHFTCDVDNNYIRILSKDEVVKLSLKGLISQ